MFIDSHAHLTSKELLPHVDSLLLRAKEAGVSHVVNICTDLDTLQEGLRLAQKYPWVVNTAATTPHDVEKEGEDVFPVIARHAKAGDLAAIGETGLDYYYEHSNRIVQQDFLRRYLRLALECKLPVVIHCRQAFADFFSILDEEFQVGGKHALGVLHCFTGTVEEAQQVVKRGWYLSLSGIVTYKKSDALREVAKSVPLDQLLIETDAPYLAPQSKRGKVNEPAFVAETCAVIAQVRNVSLEVVAQATSENTKRLFGLKD